MPIRLTCPSCSAALSVKDEYAGRAVRCPKCGGVIPPPAPAMPVAPPGSAPAAASPPAEPPPLEASGEPPTPAPSGPKITGRPVAKSRRDEDDEEDRPRRRERDDDRDGRDDRPRRRRREDGDDRPARGRKKEGGSGAGMVLAIIGGLLLVCCVGGIGLTWFVVTKVREKAQEIAEDIEKRTSPVTYHNYQRFTVGTTTRGEMEQVLGPGRTATGEDIAKAFPNDVDKTQRWMEKVVRNRAVVWQNGDDYLVAAFHPNANADARLQMKEWRPKSGANAATGELNDTIFLRQFPPLKPNGPLGLPEGNDEEPPPGTAFLTVNSLDLAQEYNTDPAGADARYKDKWLEVRGKVDILDPGGPKDSPGAKLEGVPVKNGKLLVWCFGRPDEANKVLNLTRGQTVTFRGKCVGNPFKTYVRLEHARVLNPGPDPAIRTSARSLVLEFSKNAEAANTKYEDKEVFLTDAEFVSAAESVANFKTPGAGPPISIQANFAFNQNDKLKKLKPGERVRFKARAGLLFGQAPKKYVSFYEAYLVPNP